jgi:hypothetical protein
MAKLSGKSGASERKAEAKEQLRPEVREKRRRATQLRAWAQWAEREAKEAKKDLDSWEAMDQEDVLRDMRDLGL